MPPGGGYVVGSRSEWLTARGDPVANPAMGLADAVRDLAEGPCERPDPRAVLTYYGDEVYGGAINEAGGQYAGGGAVGFRLFDVARRADFADRPHTDPAALAAWRGGGGPAFLPEDELTAAERFGAALTPASARPRRCRQASPKRRRGWGKPPRPPGPRRTAPPAAARGARSSAPLTAAGSPNCGSRTTARPSA